MATRTINPQSNPYASGAVVFDSTPYVDFYVKQQVQEKAKDEALDKYFNDWDKSINPAGMRNVDTQDFMNLINENKGYYLKNKAAIKNPALDNGVAYNEWFARNKEATGLVARSKDIAGKEDLINKAIIQAKQKGLPITDRVVQDLEFFRKPLKSRDWRDYNPDNLDFQPKPFDAIKFTKDIFGDVKFSERQQGKDQKLPETKQIKRVFETYIPDETFPTIRARAAAAYKQSPSVMEYVDQVSQDPIEYRKLNDLFSSKYKRPIQDKGDAAAAVALSFSPVGKTQEKIIDDKVALEAMRNANITNRKLIGGSGGGQYSVPEGGNLFDTFGEAEAIKSTNGTFTGANGLFSDKEGNPYNGEVFITKNFVPAGVYAALSAYGANKDDLSFNKGFTAIIKDGRVTALKDKYLGLIDRRTIENAQLALNKEPMKGRQPNYGVSQAAPQAKPQQPKESDSRKKVVGKKDDKL